MAPLVPDLDAGCNVPDPLRACARRGRDASLGEGARVVDAGRIVTAGGITSGMEMGFHLLRRAGYDESFLSEVARVMEYTRAYELYRNDRETTAEGEAPPVSH
jgi:transcriptional regulator GlxA family with amidase domain